MGGRWGRSLIMSALVKTFATVDDRTIGLRSPGEEGSDTLGRKQTWFDSQEEGMGASLKGLH